MPDEKKWIGEQSVMCRCSHIFDATCEIRETESPAERTASGTSSRGATMRFGQELPNSAACPKCGRFNRVPPENWKFRPLTPGEYTYRMYLRQVIGFIGTLIILLAAAYACSIIQGR